nr:ABC transporter ATP-binding protein [Gordonia sp. NB41Y]
MAQTRVEAGFGAVMGFGQVVVTLAIAVAGVWQVRQGSLSIGQLLSLTGYLGMLYPKMQEIADVRLAVASAVVSAERVAEVLDLQPTEHDSDAARALDAATRPDATARPDAGAAASPAVGPASSDTTPGVPVVLRSVSLRRDALPVLDDVDLTLSPGQITALVGPSGTGKTSLASLLCRFEHPDSGSITLGDRDYDTLTGHAIRDQVTLLPQSPVIKGATVADNIAYGRPDADRAAIIRAAQATDADEFIRALPDGYDTELHDGGLTLSGGQRQRIAMARAMIRDTPVLILDEPTSGLDDRTVSRILEPLRRIASGRTTLLITHDQRVADIADRIIELHAGHLQEQPRWILPEDLDAPAIIGQDAAQPSPMHLRA